MSTTSLRHAKCGNSVVLNLNKSLEFIGVPVIANSSVRIQSVFIRNKTNKPSYFCGNCNEEVEANDLEFLCSTCHEWLPLNKDGVSNINLAPYGGIVCTACIKTYDLNGVKPIKELLLK